MKILVTGGAGFIGGHLVRALEARGDMVRVLDDLSTGEKTRLVSGRCEFHHGSVCVPVTVGKAMEGMEAVFHLAANPSVASSMIAPLDTLRANVNGLGVVLDAARREGARCVVFVSSCAVYGGAESRCREDAPLAPLSPYGASKVCGETLVSTYARSFGLRTISLRLFNVYGPGQSPKGDYAAVIPRFAAAARGKQSPVIYGDGRQSRDFVYIDDVVTALLAAGDKADTSGHIVNIGGGRAVTLLELLDAFGRTGVGMPAPRFEMPRAGEVRHSCADISRARELLAWIPKVPLNEGVERVLALLPG